MEKVTWSPVGQPSVTMHGGSDRMMVVERGCTGLDMPPIELDTVPVIGLDGGFRMGFTVQPRDITIPVRIEARNESEFRTRFAALVRACWPTRSFSDVEGGFLHVTSTNAGRRFIEASFVGGLEGDDALERGGDTWYKALLKFRSVDPYWQSLATTQVTFSIGATKQFFPLQLGAGALRLNPNATFGTYFNPIVGDAPAYPSWQIDGPFDGFSVTNSFRRESFTFSGSVPVGGIVFLDHNPRGAYPLMVTNLPAGHPLKEDPYSAVVWPSSYWSLASSYDRVMVDVSGATAATKATLSYRTQYLSWRADQ